MRFRFRFETLLRLRRQEEEMIRNELARAMVDWERLTEEITAARIKLQEEMKGLAGSVLTAAEMADIGFDLESSFNQIEILEGQRQELAHRIEQIRQRLIEASKRRKILERLREKDFSAFRRELEAQWQKEIDELVILRHGREEHHERL
ncbi:flagellar export protein FliJ [Thermosulfuriphilus sp.]